MYEYIKEEFPMNQFWIGLIVTLAIGAVILGVLYFIGKRLEKKQTEQQAMMESMAQTINLMVVDKKRMKIKEATMLPKQVLEQTPWYLRRSRISVVKVKVGPKIMNMICEDKLFDQLPLKKELKATCSGIYMTAAKPVRGTLLPVPEKKGFFSRFRKKDA